MLTHCNKTVLISLHILELLNKKQNLWEWCSGTFEPDVHVVS